MAGVSTEQGENKLNTELNLVPFIDLLSTLTLFLLVTAVWLQVAAIPASVKSKGAGAAAPALDRVGIQLTSTGYVLSWPWSGSALPRSIGRQKQAYDRDRLELVLKNALKAHPFQTLAVSADDSVDYEYVVEAIDSAKASGVPNVALSP